MNRRVKPVQFGPTRNALRWLLASIISLIAAAFVLSFLSGSRSVHGADVPHGHAVVKQLMQQPLPEHPGREGVLLLIEMAPGHVDRPHRHDAHVFVYVLEGSVEMQVAGGKSVILKPGDRFYENPHDVHPVGRNLSKRTPAKLLAFLVKNENVPPVLPAPAR